jgi:hypothetical protein
VSPSQILDRGWTLRLTQEWYAVVYLDQRDQKRRINTLSSLGVFPHPSLSAPSSSATSKGRAWLHRAISSHSMCIASYRVEIFKQLLSYFLVKNFVRANSGLRPMH